MSASMSALYPVRPTQAQEAFPAASTPVSECVVRRLDKPAGRALEQIGHAIEYLVDTHDLSGAGDTPAIHEAVAILSRASRGIFAQCPVVPPRKRLLLRWLQQHLAS